MKHLLVLLLLPCMSVQLLAGDGSIAGRVTAGGDERGEALVGVAVMLQGTVRGTTTDAQGRYRIAGIAPGRYTVVFSLVGYQRLVLANVLVEEDAETLLDAELISTPIPQEQIVVTASKRPQSLEEVPVSTAILEKEEIGFRNSQTVEDALRYIPGVNITGRQVNIRGSSGYAVGVGSRVMMQLDGIPFITGDTGELIFESVPVGQIDRIEVVKGASSALYGTSALGGVINVITKPIPETPETYVRTYAGLYNKPSFEKWKWTDRNLYFTGVALSHAFKAGDLGIVFALSRQTDDGYRKNDHRKRHNVYLKTEERFSSENSLTMNFGLLNEYGGKFNYWQNLDSALLPFRLQRDDEIKSTRYYLSGTYRDVVAENLVFTAKGLWNYNSFVSTTWHDSGAGRWKDIKGSVANGFRLEAGATWMLNAQHTVTAGAEGQLDLVTSDLFSDRKAYGGAFYGQDEWKINEQWMLTFGFRLDLQSLYLTQSSPQFNPKLALTYTPFEGTTFRTSLGRGFRVPSVAEAWVSLDLGLGFFVPSPNLKPERSYSYELGVSQRLGEVGTVDVAVFSSWYNDLVEPRAYSNETRDTLFVQWQNVAKARVQGFETSLRWGFFDGALQYSLGYTYVYPEDLSPPDTLAPRKNNILPYRPRHVLYSNVLGHVGVLRVGVDFRYISRVDRVYDLFAIIQDADERVAIVVTDFRLGADFSSLGVPLTATFSINNAFRYNYLELTANVSPPRTFVLALEAKL